MYIPKISVLLPVYNGWPFIQEAVESILRQTLPPTELVIIDDGSTDETLHYLHGLRHHGDIKLYTFPENRGLISALNFGLTVCQGEIIARMDCDDISLPHRFERQWEFLCRNPTLDGCGAWIRYFGRDSQVVTFPKDPDEVRDRLFEFTTVPHPTYFMHRHVYDQLPYPTTYPHSEDVDWLFRATEIFKFSNVQEVLLLYRTGKHQICSMHREQKEQDRPKIEAAAWERRGLQKRPCE